MQALGDYQIHLTNSAPCGMKVEDARPALFVATKDNTSARSPDAQVLIGKLITLTRIPDEIVTPSQAPAFSFHLNYHPNQAWVRFLLDIIRRSADIGYRARANLAL